MDNKLFRPVIADATAENIHQQYGIAEDRLLQLGHEIAMICQEMERREEVEMTWGIDRVADFTDTPAEFAFCVMTLTLALHKHLLL